MNSSAADDPLIGDELIKIELEQYSVNLVFVHSIVKICANFLVKDKGAIVATIDPDVASDMKHLRALLGHKIKNVIWSESVSIEFEGSTVIEIAATPGVPRGEIMGRNDMTYEEF